MMHAFCVFIIRIARAEGTLDVCKDCGKGYNCQAFCLTLLPSTPSNRLRNFVFPSPLAEPAYACQTIP